MKTTAVTRATTVPHPRNLLTLVDTLPAGTEFTTLAFGPHQLPLTTMSMLLGGHVRVGLEDNLYYRKGEPAESSAQLVEWSVRIAEELGRPVATPTEARRCWDCDGTTPRKPSVPFVEDPWRRRPVPDLSGGATPSPVP